MRRDPTEFRERFAKWKAGEKVYENGLPKYGGGKKAVAFRRTIADDDDAFYQRMQERQAQLDSPKVLYTRQNNNPVKFDEQGNLVDLVTGETGTMMLPEVRITPKRYDAYHSTFDPDVIRNFTDWLPVVGDIGTSIDIKNAIKNQNYLEAGLLGGMMVLPPVAGKALKPITKYGRFLSKAETDTYTDALNSMYKNSEKDVQRFYDNELPKIYELDDIAKKVYDKAGSTEYYSSLEDALSFPMLRTFGKNTLRRDVTDYILNKKGFPATYGNRDLLLDGLSFEKLTPWQIKVGEKYDPKQFDMGRIEKSTVKAAIPYISDAIPELSTYLAQKIVDKYPWITKRLIDDKVVQKSGKPFIDMIPTQWDGITNIVNQMNPLKVKRNIKWGMSKLDQLKKDELMRQYREFRSKNPSEQMKYTTDDGAVITIDPDSKTSAAYFNPEEALKQAQSDFDKILPGESWALVDNGALSPDSYTLLEALTRRHAKSGKIHVVIKPDGTVSMLKLNAMNKYRTIEHVKKAVSNLRKTTGIKLPDPYENNGYIYAPNFYWTKNL